MSEKPFCPEGLNKPGKIDKIKQDADALRKKAEEAEESGKKKGERSRAEFLAAANLTADHIEALEINQGIKEAERWRKKADKLEARIETEVEQVQGGLKESIVSELADDEPMDSLEGGREKTLRKQRIPMLEQRRLRESTDVAGLVHNEPRKSPRDRVAEQPTLTVGVEAPDQEVIKKGEWLPLKVSEATQLAEDYETGILAAAFEHGYTPLRPIRARNAGVWRRAAETVFKNGLKPGFEPFPADKEIKIRFIDAEPKEKTGNEKVVSAGSYEISVFLKPRFEKDGDAKPYVLGFTIEIKSFSRGWLTTNKAALQEINPEEKIDSSADNYVYSTTSQNQRAKKKIWEQVDADIQLSKENYFSVLRAGLRNMYFFRGGAPGLGKKR